MPVPDGVDHRSSVTEPEDQSGDASSSSLPRQTAHYIELPLAYLPAESHRTCSQSPIGGLCGRDGRPHQPFGPKCFPTHSYKAGPQSPGMAGSGQWRGSTRSDTAARGRRREALGYFSCWSLHCLEALPLQGGGVAKNVGSCMSTGSPAPADRPSLDVIMSKKEADAVLSRRHGA